MLKKMQNCYPVFVWEPVKVRIKHERRCFIEIFKHREDSRKYDTQRSIFDEYKFERDVWIAEETLSRLSFQSKQNLRSKRKIKK